MNQDMKTKVEAYLAEHRGQILQDLISLCRINSEKTDAAPGAPFGAGVAAALEAAAGLAASMGFEAKVYGEQGYALATLGTGEKTIGFFGHCDVVPAGTGWTTTQPYEPLEKDGILFGRGVADNKNGVIASLWVMKAIKDLGLPMNSRLLTFMGGDEESGMEDIQSFAENQPMPDLCLIPDTAFPVCNGEKGILDVVVQCKTPFRQILALEGGLASNVVIGEALAKIGHSDALLAQLKELATQDLYTVESDGSVITIYAKGRSSHASRPDGSLNAARLLADLLGQCDIDPSDKKILADVSTALQDDYAQTMGFAAEDAESGRMTVACGIARTEEGRLSLTFNPRYCVTIQGEQVVEGFRRYFEPRDWELTHVRDSQGYYIPRNDARVTTLMNIYKSLTGDVEAQPYVMGGGTYARKLKNALAFGPDFEREDGLPYALPAGHGGVHQPDEGLVIEDLIKGIALYIIAVAEVDKVL